MLRLGSKRSVLDLRGRSWKGIRAEKWPDKPPCSISEVYRSESRSNYSRKLLFDKLLLIGSLGEICTQTLMFKNVALQKHMGAKMHVFLILFGHNSPP